MTPTRVAAAQPMPTAPSGRQIGEGKDPGGEAPSGDAAQEFSALFTMITTNLEAAAGGASQSEVADAGEELLPRRPVGTGKSKALQPEDVLPTELLLTLYPQMAIPRANANPPAMPANQDAAKAVIVAALTGGSVADPGADQSPDDASANTASASSTPMQVGTQSVTSPAFMAALASADALARTAPQPPAAVPPATTPALPTEPQPATTVAATAVAAVQQSMATPPVARTDLPAAKPAGPAQQRTDLPASDGEKAVTSSEASTFATTPSQSQGREAPVPPEQPRKFEFTVVTRQETFLPPAGHPRAAQQAFEKIVADLQQADSPAGPDASSIRRETTTSPMRVLHIQLQPPELGTLTVKLSLRDNALDIKLEAAEHHTVRILEADRDRLSSMLRSAGYAVDGLTVQMPAGDRSAPNFSSFAGGSDNAAAYGGGGAQPGGAQPDAQRGQPQGRPGEGGTLAGNGEEGDPANPVRSTGGDLYI